MVLNSQQIPSYQPTISVLSVIVCTQIWYLTPLLELRGGGVICAESIKNEKELAPPKQCQAYRQIVIDIDGKIVPTSFLHIVYVLLEMAKLVLLVRTMGAVVLEVLCSCMSESRSGTVGG